MWLSKMNIRRFTKRRTRNYRGVSHTKRNLAVLFAALVCLVFVYVLFNLANHPTVASKDLNSSKPSQQASSKPDKTQSTPNSSTVFQQSADPLLVLVNNKNAFPSTYQQEIIDYHGVNVDKRIVEPYESMKKAAAKAGVTLWISSGYRSVEQQKTLFEKEVELNTKKGLSTSEAENTAQKSVARPGYSEHNTGLAVDLNGVSPDFKKTKAYTWLLAHSAEYGFILRFPESKSEYTGVIFEPWHFRYVGTENALKIKDSNLCLEEYLQSMQK